MSVPVPVTVRLLAPEIVPLRVKAAKPFALTVPAAEERSIGLTKLRLLLLASNVPPPVNCKVPFPIDELLPML